MRLGATWGVVMMLVVAGVVCGAEGEYRGKALRHWTELAERERAGVSGEAIAALAEAAGSERIGDVVAAADAIELIGPKAAAAAGPALAGKLDHPLGWVRTAAMNALRAMGAEGVPALVEVFEKGPAGARMRAGLVLGSIGPEARGALPALRKALEGAPEGQREGLREIIAQIESAAAAPAETGGESGVGAAGATAPVAQGIAPATSDWPGFHGPNRDSISREGPLLKRWPAGGPALLWKIEGLGKGYSTVSIANGRLFTMGDRPAAGGEAQHVMAFELAGRKRLWSVPIGPGHEDGPRCTPTVAGDRVYALGTDGDLVCLDVRSGEVRWRKHLMRDFGGRMMSGWKYSESPLVDGERVICTPGGAGAAMVALDRQTGEVLWKAALPELGPAGKDGAGYSSAVVAEIGGVRQYVQMTGRGVVAVEAATGRFLWGYNRIASRTANITHPLVLGDRVFVTNSYDAGSALLKVAREGDAFKVEELYRLGPRVFENHHGGVVAVGGYLFGGSGQNRGEPVCVSLATGKVAWRAPAPGRGSAAALYADGHLVLRYDRGLVALVEATPEAFRLKGTFEPVRGEGAAWAHPVIHQGRLYLRHGDLLACYDVRETGR